MDYRPKPTVSYNGTVYYSRADNFDDFTVTGLPLEADFDRIGVTASLKWSLAEDVSIAPICGVYRHGANRKAEVHGSYTALIAGVEASLHWG